MAEQRQLKTATQIWNDACDEIQRKDDERILKQQVLDQMVNERCEELKQSSDSESPEENGSLTGWGNTVVANSILLAVDGCGEMVATKAYVDSHTSHASPMSITGDMLIELPSGEANLVDVLLRMQEEIAQLKERLQMNEVEATPKEQTGIYIYAPYIPKIRGPLVEQPTRPEDNWDRAMGMIE